MGAMPLKRMFMDFGQGWKSILFIMLGVFLFFPIHAEEESVDLFYKNYYPKLNGLEFSCKKTSTSVFFNKDKKLVTLFDSDSNAVWTGLIQPDSIICNIKKKKVSLESVWIKSQSYMGGQQKIRLEISWDDKGNMNSLLAQSQGSSTFFGSSWETKLRCSDGDIILVQAQAAGQK
jgi:hypothetical protein